MRTLLVLLVLAVTASIANADPSAATEKQMRAREAMTDYFDGEKTGGYVLIGMGVGGLVAGGLLYRQYASTSAQRGAAYPLLGLGLAHLAAGIFINISSANRVDKFGDEIDQDASAWVERESKRMAGVSTQFTILKIVEIGLIAGGLTMAGIGARTDRPRLKGAGLALALEAGLTLGFDIWAASRASSYRRELDSVGMIVGCTPLDDRPVAMITHTFTF
jgi:hypothetical protein